MMKSEKKKANKEKQKVSKNHQKFAQIFGIL